MSPFYPTLLVPEVYRARSRWPEWAGSSFPFCVSNSELQRLCLLQHVSYRLGEPVFDVKECQIRGVTYSAPLRVKLRLIVYEREAPEGTVKDIKNKKLTWVKFHS
ncbi:hypothetical protein ACLK1S_24765 [Escherichia coli]